MSYLCHDQCIPCYVVLTHVTVSSVDMGVLNANSGQLQAPALSQLEARLTSNVLTLAPAASEPGTTSSSSTTATTTSNQLRFLLQHGSNAVTSTAVAVLSTQG